MPCPLASPALQTWQVRRRVYIVGQSVQYTCKQFGWPAPIPSIPVEEILETSPPGTSLEHLRNALPPVRMRCARKIVIQALASLRRQGIDPFVTHCVIDHGGSKPNFRVNGFPCLTAGRASGGGAWVTTRGRRTTPLEMVRLQGMD